jgi:hypothetical protein
MYASLLAAGSKQSGADHSPKSLHTNYFYHYLITYCIMAVEDIDKLDLKEISRRELKCINLLRVGTNAAILWVRQKLCWGDLVIQRWHQQKHAQRGLKTQFPICAEAENNLGEKNCQVSTPDPTLAIMKT